MIVEVGATLSAQPVAGQFRKGTDKTFDRGLTVLNLCQCQLFSRFVPRQKPRGAPLRPIKDQVSDRTIKLWVNMATETRVARVRFHSRAGIALKGS